MPAPSSFLIALNLLKPNIGTDTNTKHYLRENGVSFTSDSPGQQLEYFYVFFLVMSEGIS